MDNSLFLYHELGHVIDLNPDRKTIKSKGHKETLVTYEAKCDFHSESPAWKWLYEADRKFGKGFSEALQIDSDRKSNGYKPSKEEWGSECFAQAVGNHFGPKIEKACYSTAQDEYTEKAISSRVIAAYMNTMVALDCAIINQRDKSYEQMEEDRRTLHKALEKPVEEVFSEATRAKLDKALSSPPATKAKAIETFATAVSNDLRALAGIAAAEVGVTLPPVRGVKK